MAPRHNVGKVALIVLTFLLLLGTIFVASAATIPQLRGLLPATWFIEDLNRNIRPHPLTPANWVFFIIWPLSFFFQLCFVVYSLTLTCRKANDNQGYLYDHPGHMPYLVFIFYNLGNAIGIVWLFVNDRGIIAAATPLLWSFALMLHISLILSYAGFIKHGPALMRMNHRNEVSLVRVFVHNGIATYVTWSTLASNVQTTGALVYSYGMGVNLAGLIMHGAVAGQVILFFALDLSILDRFTRYTFTPYFVLILALSGVVVEDWVANDPNSIFSAVLLAVSVVGLLAKIIIVFQKLRTDKEPLLREKTWA